MPSSTPVATFSEAEDNSELRQWGAKTKTVKRQPLKARSANAGVLPRGGVGGKEKSNAKSTTVKSKAQAQTTRARSTAVGAKRGKTYARRAREKTIDLEADQEREDADADAEVLVGDDDVETTVHEAGKSREMASAAKRFKEVDDWEMSFESCDIVGGSSSPWR